MNDSPPTGSPATAGHLPADRLESWKEIAAYLKRDVTTVQRWEKREAMPVHRHLHDKLGSVYAFRAELDGWARSRGVARTVAGPAGAGADVPSPDRELDVRDGDGPDVPPPLPGAVPASVPPASIARREDGGRRMRARVLAVVAAVLAAAAVVWQVQRRDAQPEDPLAGARFQQLTDFAGVEQAAAISRDGRFVAFLSDRDGRMDVWVTQVGTGRFVNMTRGAAPELVNPSIRTLGFSPDGALVTYWGRGQAGSAEPDIDIWSVPLLGGAPGPYLEGAAEFDWSADGARLVYHTPGPGDPMFVREPGQAKARHVFSAPAGLHGHHLLWSPDQAFIYFVQGTLPDRLDLWRLPPDGGAAERLTHHDAMVSHPVFLDGRTLLYLASDPDGFGPFVYALDVQARTPRRVSAGVDGYTSLSASADGRRVVATRAAPKRTLWRVPLAAAPADLSAARRVPLTTGGGTSPRLGPGFLVYVSPKGLGDAVWKLQDGAATELWSAPDARVIGAPAIRRDGRRIAFTVRQRERTVLYAVNADGTEANVVTRALDLRGAPAWAPDGRSLTVAARVDGEPRLFSIPLEGGAPAPFLAEHALDPAWSPSGDVVVYSGADVGTKFPVKAANPDATARPLPDLTLTRGSRHLVFAPGGRELALLRGEIRHKNVWLVDLDTGAERPLTDLPPEFEVRDFDLSPDGRELVLEQVQEDSDVVLIERPRR